MLIYIELYDEVSNIPLFAPDSYFLSFISGSSSVSSHISAKDLSPRFCGHAS